MGSASAYPLALQQAVSITISPSRMPDIAESVISNDIPRRVFKNHKRGVVAVAVFPNGRRMVTGSHDMTLCLWDLKDGVVLKKTEGHRNWVAGAVAVSDDSQLIASGDGGGQLIAWDGDTGQSLTKVIKAHSDRITSLDFSPDSAVLATVSEDKTIKLWRTDTWQIHGNPINAGERIYCARYSPSGKLLAITTVQYIQIWNMSTLKCIAKITVTSFSLGWTPDGTRLLSGGGDGSNSTIREWDTSTWMQVGDPWSGHTDSILDLTINSTGTLLASASHDKHVRLWRVSDQRTIAVFSHLQPVNCVTFSADGKYILSGGYDNTINEWSVPDSAFLEKSSAQTSSNTPLKDVLDEPRTNDAPDYHYKILSINTTVRNACLNGDLFIAKELLTQEINQDRDNANAYANRSFISSQKCDWDGALQDALQSISIQPSLIGYISKGIALCGKMEFRGAMNAFDFAFMFTGQDSSTTHLILLVKAIALFNANQQEEAMQRVKELAAVCPDADTVACHIVEAYLHIQLGISVLSDGRCNDAVDYFNAAINNGGLSNEQVIHSRYEIFAILFGWDLTSCWRAAYQNRCDAFLQMGKPAEAHDGYKYMMEMYDEAMKASCLEWSSSFKKKCSALYIVGADVALARSAYDRAIELYSCAIDLDLATDTIFANRCKAKLGKMLWIDALSDAQKVAELNPSSYLGYHLKHAALHGAQRYDEAIEVLRLNLIELSDLHDPEMQALKKEYHALYVAGGDTALAACAYDRAIELYTIAIDLTPATDSIYAHRCQAKLEMRLWEEALDDARKVTELNPSSHLGFQLKHAALHGAQRYREAIEVLKLNLAKLHSAHDPEMQSVRKECHALCVASGDTALAAGTYDEAIDLYSAAIALDSLTDSTFANRCKAKLGMMLWEEALVDAQKVIELNTSYIGYQLKHAALHGAHRYDEAIKAFEIMLLRLDEAHDIDIQALRQQYITPSETQCTIRTVIDIHMEHTPSRLLDTSTGRLCDRKAQINTFITSSECSELLSSIVNFQDASLRMQRIQDTVATFFSYVMLSHRWEGKEACLRDIDGGVLYELNPVGGIIKLQAFCKIVQDAGHRWAWADTCCIDQNNNVEVQRSVNSMFAWYRHSALTIIYLSDVPSSSRFGAMARSTWNTRGWTVQEFLAPNAVLFYQSDWTLYPCDHSSNHKKSTLIIRELEDATGINGQALITFQPGMTGAREKLQWASMRITTIPEDIAYSLFGVFGVHLPVIYGETRQNALGRLLQEIIALSGDISCLDWIGKSSEFNSFLPANITAYGAPPFVPPPLSEDDVETSVSLLRDAGATGLACQLYTTLHELPTPRFAQRRLHLPCIVFTVTQVRVAARPGKGQETRFTYAVKANGLGELSITTKDELMPFSRHTPNRQKLLLVRPWDRNLLRLYNCPESSIFADDAQSFMTEDSRTIRSSLLGDDVLVDPQRELRALRLTVGLRQPFRAFLLATAQEWGREYKRIAADHDIIAQIKYGTSVRYLIDVRTLEIL